jgi:hypothetical protein
MSNKIGEQSWTANTGNDAGEGVSRSDFMRLSHGSNVVRILTLPYGYYVHKVENPNGSGKNWGTRIPCTNSPDCPVCKTGNKAKKKYYLGCIERETGMYKILDIGYSVFKGLQVFAQDEEWGPDFSQYDVDIVVNQKGTPMDYYRCSPKPKRNLSETDLLTKAEHSNTDELVKRCQPWTVERAQAALDKMNEDNEAHFESDLVMKGKDVSDDDASSDDFFTNYDTVKSAKK